MHVEIMSGDELGDVPDRVVSLKVWDLKDEHIAKLAKLHSLKHLKIEGEDSDPQWGTRACYLGDSSIEVIAKLPNLETLAICAESRSESYFGDDGMSAIAGIETLRSLEMGMNDKLSDVGLDALSMSPHMESLTLGRIKHMGPNGARAIAGMTNLNDLSLSFYDKRYSGISGSDLTNISAMKSLRRLHLFGLGDPRPAIEAIASLPSLEWLNLGAMSFDDDTLALLATAPVLRSLNLVFNKEITDYGLTRLIEKIWSREVPAGGNIRELELNQCENVSPKGISTVMEIAPEIWISVV